MFHAKIITKKEEEKLVPLKKTKLDKIDRSGMKSLSSFFGRCATKEMTRRRI